MKIYIDENDIGKTVTFKEENGKRQYLYVHDNEGFIFKELSEHDKQVRKEVCEEIRNKIDQAKMIYEWKGEEITIEDILDQIQGE